MRHGNKSQFSKKTSGNETYGTKSSNGKTTDLKTAGRMGSLRTGSTSMATGQSRGRLQRKQLQMSAGKINKDDQMDDVEDMHMVSDNVI